MVIHLDADSEWVYEAQSPASVTFASASARGETSQLAVFFNDAEIECVNLPVPHSWWPSSGQPFCPPLVAGDVLRLVGGQEPVDIRLDLIEHEA